MIFQVFQTYNHVKIWYQKIRDLQCGEEIWGQNVGNYLYDWAALKKSIEKHGIINPIVLTKLDNAIVDGNHRLAVAKLIYPPDKEIACVYEDREFWKSYEDRLKSKYRLTI